MCVIRNILTAIISNPFFQCDTLIKYLVDSLQSFENGHGGALHPIPIDPTNFFMGDDSAMKTATSEEIRQLAASVNRTMDTLSTTVHSVLSQTTSARDHLQSTPRGQMEGVNIPGFGYGCSEVGSTLLTPGGSSHIGFPQNYKAWNSQTSTASHQINSTGSATSCSSVSSIESRGSSRSMSSSPLPIAGVSIPSLGHGRGAWRRAIKQWTEVDPQTGLALKDWPAKWYTGLMRTTTGSLRSQRQVIFEEYEW